MTTLALIYPIDPGSGGRLPVRVCSSQDEDATGALGQIWYPAMDSQPVLSMSLFDGDFSSEVSPAQARIAIRLGVLKSSGRFARVGLYDWSGAAVTLYRMVGGQAAFLAEMRVRAFAAEDDVLGLDLAVDQEPFDADVLFRKYAGTTGAEGGENLKDQPKPWLFGRCLNVEPVAIDLIDNVFQVSGYGPVSAIPAVYERGASFGSSLGDFASYAALVAADIPEGRWGTCLAQGMFRLGAPPAGVITADVDGDSTTSFLRRTGAVIAEIARRLDLAERVDAASLAALDSAVPRDINIVLSQQITLIELARQMAAPCNAVAGVGLDGRLIMPRIALGTPSITLDAQGRQMPPVLGVARQNTRPPYSEIKMGAARSWRVHSFEEVAFFADLIDRGLYDAAATYREGNIVESVDKSRWVYVNPAPSSGNAPPTWPTTSNAYWSNLSSPASEDPAVANASITIDSGGVLNGIGTPGVSVGNNQVVLEGAIDDRPGGGNFVGQLFSATDTGEVTRWNGTSWEPSSDITSAAIREIVAQFPIIEIKQGEAGNSGARTVLHSAKRGGANLLGGTWSLVSQTLGAGSASVGSGTGTVTLTGIVQSGRYTIRYTHTDSVQTDLAVNVSYFAAPSEPGGASASGGLISISTDAFVMISPELAITLPTGVTEADLSATNVDLDLSPESPSGTTTVEFKWQRNTAPDTWVDVGSAATSSPNPAVIGAGGFFETSTGSITCDRTATGLDAGSAQVFRLVARISAGNVRLVIVSGTAIATA